MRLVVATCVMAWLLASSPGVNSVKPFPTATKPPVPPPPPPFLIFGDYNFNNIDEMIAPTHMQSGFKPTLSIVNPDYNVGVSSGNRPRPQRPQQAQQQPLRPQRPQQQPTRPQRPQKPRPRPPRPFRPFSQVVARPPVKIPPRPSKPSG